MPGYGVDDLTAHGPQHAGLGPYMCEVQDAGDDLLPGGGEPAPGFGRRFDRAVDPPPGPGERPFARGAVDPSGYAARVGHRRHRGRVGGRGRVDPHDVGDGAIVQRAHHKFRHAGQLADAYRVPTGQERDDRVPERGPDEGGDAQQVLVRSEVEVVDDQRG